MADMRARAGIVVRGIEERRRRLVADRVRQLAPTLVADVGCEDGWIAESYVDHVEHVFLCDLDPTRLRTTPLAERDHVDILACDALDPMALGEALDGRQLDLLVLSALLEHLPAPEAALRALLPLVKDGGRLLIYLPADGPILLAKRVLKTTGLGRLLRGLSLDPAPGHLHQFARADVARLVRPFGVVEELTFDPLCLGYVAVVRRQGEA